MRAQAVAAAVIPDEPVAIAKLRLREQRGEDVAKETAVDENNGLTTASILELELSTVNGG
jgi:hypothetical protein